MGIEVTDMLFIHTWRTYTQPKIRLATHAHKVGTHLVSRDTSTCGEVGKEPGSLGLCPAVEQFLQGRPERTLTPRLENNNGLTILTRPGAPLPTSGSGPARFRLRLAGVWARLVSGLTGSRSTEPSAVARGGDRCERV